MMQEAFLHFLWQFGYFNRSQLTTTGGEAIQILHPGYPNADAGPDFSQARLRIGPIEWVGNVEIHIHSSDWHTHHHQEDDAYDQVILHVVWLHDQDVYRKDHSLIPTLLLANRIDHDLLTKYQYFTSNTEDIPCASQFGKVNAVYKIQALENALMHRLSQKADLVTTLLARNHYDWEETTYQLLARNLGFKLNNDPFLQLSQAVPLKLLHKHSDQLMPMEALLFGQAGLLDTPLEDTYYRQLQKEYSFLSHKYSLRPSKLDAHAWKFFRLRPANFPTLRIAYLAALLQKHKNLFSLFIHLASVKDFLELFHLQPSPYWQQHYTFGKTSPSVAHFGKESKENILINTVVPLLVCYSKVKGKQLYTDRAIELLEALPAENNRITRFWKHMDLPIDHALDGQGSIELYNHFCMQKKCLSCPVGISLLKPARTPVIH
ncbi:DUF2851 family protein [Rhodocytophaga aerolata]|uniref:DUF2851 family protein n=1 Tax=Rhodocytophaga aerolata TaxID=455078 RepID=A0ABT8RA68_9BACT|nr:DUF2851 family protein [Rhodocytophaga aerolata]MDO1448998.1 DUF2851 family protein [Rhodocytophaga aerolata]